MLTRGARAADALDVAGTLHNPELARALRRLTALGLRLGVEAGADTLAGGFTPPPSALRDPLDGTPIESIRVRVGPDARLRVVAPAVLAGSFERAWYQIGTLAQLCAELQGHLDKRQAEAESDCQELESRGFEPEIDPESRRPGFVLALEPGRAVHFECADGRVVARTLHAAGAAPRALDGLELPLASLPEAGELAREVAEALECGRSGDAPAAPAAASPGITLGALFDALGPAWTLGAGATLHCTTAIHGGSARLELTLPESGAHTLRLLDAQGERFRRPIEPEALAHWERSDAPSLRPPIVGQTWRMDVRVESDDGREVRYRAVNVGGEDYGAPRVLRRDWFEETFLPAADGFCLRVRVLEVDAQGVSYRRLSAQDEPVGELWRAPLVVFLASFVAEAGH
jgi:hypothetical protein